MRRYKLHRFQKQITQIIFILFLFLSTINYKPSTAFAEVPKTMNFQGRLTDANDQPLNGDHTFNFSIYDVSSGGQALWNETQTILVSDGIYNCQLGSATPLNLDFNKPYYLEVTVDNNSLLPRQVISSSPYSLNSIRLDGKLASDFALTNHTHNASYNGDSSTYPAPSTTSTRSIWAAGFETTLPVQKDDIVMVILSVSLRNASANHLTYMRAHLKSGSATALLAPNWITSQGQTWQPGTSIGIYKAAKDENLTFAGYWHVGSGTGYHVYGNMAAWIIGKE